MTTVDATTDPHTANALLAGALSDNPVPSAPAQVPSPKIQPPPELQVELMAGIVYPLEASTARDAVVRELTGADEEALTSPSLARSVGKYLKAVAERGTDTIGGKKVTSEQHAGLLIGDRELLLLGIRKATYGTTMDLITVCPHCETRDNEYVFDLNTIPLRELEDVSEAIFGFTVTLPSGHTAHVNLPKAGDQDVILAAGEKSEGELNTLMLSRCVDRLDEDMIVSDAQVRALTIRDRRFLMAEINKKTPGPRLGEVKRTCGACEKEFPLNLGLLDLFQA